MTSAERLKDEFQLFKSLHERLKSRTDYVQLDEFGFALSQSAGIQDKIVVDMLVCGLTHGNEVIGLEIINLMLQDILSQNLSVKMAFLLNNIEAYHQSLRFLDYDLNRSFLSADRVSKREFNRAHRIEQIIERLEVRLIIDLHQTVEPTKSAFAVVPEAPHLIRLSKKIAPEIPVVSFKNGSFSNKGRTLAEYAFEKQIPALVYELGQKGFIRERAEQFKTILININSDKIKFADQEDHPTDYYHIESLVPNQNDFKLLPGFQSYMQIKKDQVLAINTEGFSYKSPSDAMIIFPRYAGFDKSDRELAYIAVKKKL